MNTATTNEPASRRALRSTHRVLIKGMLLQLFFLDTSCVIFSYPATPASLLNSTTIP